MRVLLTGASSFTGYWFARALRARGAELVLPLARGKEDGDAERRARIAELETLVRVELVPHAPFGSDRFLELLRRRGPFDLLACHGARVGDHRRADFDVLDALRANTHRLPRVLDAALEARCRTVLLTGSVFEAGEGIGPGCSQPFNRYGLSKTLTWHVFRDEAERRGLTLGKFTIAAPFGPHEKRNLCRHLVEGWLRGEEPELRHPHLLRDHIPVDLLAEAYARFAFALPARTGTHRLVPSCFAETLAAFADRLAAELRPRLGRPCRLRLADPPPSTDEPRVRLGEDPVMHLVPGWDFARSFDRLAAHYLREGANGPRARPLQLAVPA